MTLKEKYGGNEYLDTFSVNFLVPAAADEQVLIGITMICEGLQPVGGFGYHP